MIRIADHDPRSLRESTPESQRARTPEPAAAHDEQGKRVGKDARERQGLGIAQPGVGDVK